MLEDLARSERATLGLRGEARLRDALAAAVLGAGPLEALIAEPGVTDVVVNGTGDVWVDRGAGMTRVELDLGPEAARRALAVRLAGLAGRRLDDAAAYVDAVLPSGVRLHAILPPLVADGPHLTLRVPAQVRLAMPQLAAAGSFPPGWEEVLRRLVGGRRSFVVSGGTGAGKTTLLAALLGVVESHERIVVVEDVRELTVDHPHVVRLQGRAANVEGVGEVPMTTLVRQALRMRPDRIVVGEVRGAEVRDLLAALNTGHEGGCGTVHANAVGDVVARFEALGALAGMSVPAVHAQFVSGVQAVVHVRRAAGGRRIVDSIGVVLGDRARRATVLPALGRSADLASPAGTSTSDARRRLGELVGDEAVSAALGGASPPDHVAPEGVP